jgi:hypothetical protein
MEAGMAHSRNGGILETAAAGFHVICCGAPALLSLTASVLNVGLFAGAANALDQVHDAIHGIEPHLLAISGLVILAGLALHAQRWNRARLAGGTAAFTQGTTLLMIASTLFLVNLLLFFFGPHGLGH